MLWVSLIVLFNKSHCIILQIIDIVIYQINGFDIMVCQDTDIIR